MDRRAGLDPLRGQPADALDPLDEARRSGFAMEDHRYRLCGELTLRHVSELFQIVVGQHWVGHLEAHRLRGALLEQIPAGPE